MGPNDVMTESFKRYRIEDTHPADLDVMDDLRPFSIEAQQQHAEILANLGELKELVRPVQEVSRDMLDAYRREIMEVAKLRGEMTAISDSIEDTRRQLASMHVGAPSAINLDRMTGELDAVVSATAAATNRILSAAEGIQDASTLLLRRCPPDETAELERVQDLATGIFEACNFQDLTGQRITRLLDTLSFIESRVERMMEIWGGLETIDGLISEEAEALARERETEGVHTLVNGPKLADDVGHVDQDDIDQLFC